MFSLLEVSVSRTSLLDLLVVFPSSVSNITALKIFDYWMMDDTPKHLSLYLPIIVFIIIKLTVAGAVVPSSLQCYKIWQIKTTSSLNKIIWMRCTKLPIGSGNKNIWVDEVVSRYQVSTVQCVPKKCIYCSALNHIIVINLEWI